MITYKQGKTYLKNFNIETQRKILEEWTHKYNMITGVYCRTQMYILDGLILKNLWKWHENQKKDDGLDIFE
jgi:hypothetical protein